MAAATAVGAAAVVLAGATADAATGDAGSAPLAVTVNGVPVDASSALATQPVDVEDQSYTVCYPDGQSSTTQLTGYSVGALLRALDIAPGATRSLSVPRIAASGTVVLLPADFDPSATGYPSFPEGPAVIVERTTGSQQSTVYDFFRPYRSPSCASGPNGDDHVVTPVGGTLHVAVASGTALTVTATAGTTAPRVGQVISFSGQVSNPPTGSLDYRWSFGDGTVATGQTTTHAFATAGSYTVSLTADQGAAAGGAAPPLTLTVGAAATGSPRPGGSTTDRATPSTTARPRRSASARATATTAASPNDTRAAGDRPTPTAPPLPATPLPATSGRTSGPAASAAVTTPLPARRTAAAAAVSPYPSPPPTTSPADPAGVLVAGQLIAARTQAGSAVPSRSPAGVPVAAALSQALAGRGATPAGTFSVPATALAGAALLGCLGGGAVLQLLDRRRPGRGRP